MEQNKEIWKDIEGYEGLYMISKCGRAQEKFNENLVGVMGQFRLLAIMVHQHTRATYGDTSKINFS